MELLLGVLWLAGIVWGGKKAAEAVADGYRKSRHAAAKKTAKGKLSPSQRGRHAAAWWTREAGQGFPVTRAGFQRGWLAHQTAMDQHRARREEARTSHLEARASVLSELAAHRKRQEDAQKLIDQATAPELPEEKPRPEQQPAPAVTPIRNLDTLPPRPAGSIQQEGTPMTTRSMPEHGQDRPGHNVSPTGAWYGSGGGSTDANYTESLQQAKEVAAEADAALGDIRWQKMANLVDSIGGLMRGDTATLSDCADVADALAAQKKAMEHTRDTAEAFATNLQKRHGGIKEAHDDAPVKAAESQFYDD